MTVKVLRHYSETTRNLIAASRALSKANSLMLEARGLLAVAGGGEVTPDLNSGTFDAIFALNRGRDCDGEPEPGGDDVLEKLERHIASSIAQDDKARVNT